MELISRDLQGQLLEALGSVYPAWVVPRTFCDERGFDRRGAGVNLEYLLGHGLIEKKARSPVSIHTEMAIVRSPEEIRISHTGIDFLAGDGGLTAILKVVTVRMHEDTVRDLLIARVQQAEGSGTVKEALVKQIKEMPAEGVKTLATTALQAGIAAMPQFIQWISGVLT